LLPFRKIDCDDWPQPEDRLSSSDAELMSAAHVLLVDELVGTEYSLDHFEFRYAL